MRQTHSGPAGSSTVAWGLFVLAAMLAYYAAFYFSSIQIGGSDPDRYYHLALARITNEQGFPRILPQVEDLGWGQYFPDKEYLFHALTAAAYRLGGDHAVLAVIPLLGSAVSLVLYGTLVRVLAPWKAALVALVPVLGTVRFLHRLMLLRPHVLAMLFFCVILWAILRRHRWGAVLGILGFTLAYHAFYIPVMVIALAWPLRATVENPDGLPLSWLCMALLAGLLLNPYFPSNLVMTLSHIWVALGSGLPLDMQPGQELLPLTLSDFFFLYPALPLTVALLGVCYIAGVYRGKAEADNYRFLLVLATLLTLLSFKSQRATEYALPTTVLLLGHALAHFASRRVLLATGTCWVAMQWPSALAFYTNVFTTSQQTNAAVYLDAMRMLPDDAAGSKVFNCQWDAAPYLLYGRPDLRFVDILDPALLWLHDQAKYTVRQRLIAGESADPAAELASHFDADFVLCASAPFIKQMKAATGQFGLMAETKNTTPAVALFRVLRDAVPALQSAAQSPGVGASTPGQPSR